MTFEYLSKLVISLFIFSLPVYKLLALLGVPRLFIKIDMTIFMVLFVIFWLAYVDFPWDGH